MKAKSLRRNPPAFGTATERCTSGRLGSPAGAGEATTSDERQTSFKQMMEIALETAEE